MTRGGLEVRGARAWLPRAHGFQIEKSSKLALEYDFENPSAWGEIAAGGGFFRKMRNSHPPFRGVSFAVERWVMSGSFVES